MALGAPGEACPQCLQPEVQEYIWGLFDEHLDKGLAFVHSQACKEMIPTVPVNNAASAAAIFEVSVCSKWQYLMHRHQNLLSRAGTDAALLAHLQALVHPRRGFDLWEEFGEGQKVALHNIFVFCYVWGVGGNLSATSWAAFDTFVRAEFETTAVFPPSGSATVFDFCLVPER